MDYKEKIASLKENLNSLLTAENTDTITKAVSQLEEIEKIHESDNAEKQELKNRIVDIVKNTSFKDVKDGNKIDEHPQVVDVDVAISQAINKIKENRRN